MRELVISGGKKLDGEITAERAKNSVVALMAASLAIKGEVLIENCPKIGDVLVMADILRSLGARVVFNREGVLIDCSDVFTTRLSPSLTEKIRASFFVVGALIARFGTASCSRPGGCKIGSRPIDIHIEALKCLGAGSGERDGIINFFSPSSKGGTVVLRYPSVGATENAMMAACLADGVSVIRNAAKEPEIVDLQNFLNRAGARIRGGGTEVVRIDGVKRLVGGFRFKPLEDRIETGSYLLAVLATGGKAVIKDANLRNILPLVEKVKNNACQLTAKNGNIYIQSNSISRGYGCVTTSPWPGFPTDLQPQLVAASIVAQGVTKVTETVFDSRTGYVKELKKTGADISVDGRTITVNGKKIFGAEMTAEDLRGGAALVIAALAADGKSIVRGVGHIERGYLDIDKKLLSLGADVKRR